MKKLKVAYICHVSNSQIRDNLKLSNLFFENLLRKLLGKKQIIYKDYSIWNSLCFKEMENINDIELHVITPHPGMRKTTQEFIINNIYYHCFQQHSERIEFLLNRSKDLKQHYLINRRRILSFIDKIKPDIINIIGAEGAFYSLVALDIDTTKYPILLAMQTALSDPDFLKMYPMDKNTYKQLTNIEQELFKKVQYIGTNANWYRKIAHLYNSELKDVRFHFCTNLFFNINKDVSKEYDFVYYAANINKAGDDAIYAFAKAYQRNKSITLNLVGQYTPTYYEHLCKLLREEGVNLQNVTFSGYFPSHKEALQQVMRSRFALVPIKIDIVSGTIQEAMALGLPVVTFKTKGTPSLNKNSECVLLSDIGDYENMANNMLKLIENPQLAETLKNNALFYAKKNWDITANIRLLADIYHAIYENFHNGTIIPEELVVAPY